MKLQDCNLCSLCKSREHISFSKGKNDASVFIVFDKEPKTDNGQLKVIDFLRHLNIHLKYDYYYSYLIKCKSEREIKAEYVKECRKWLRMEIKKVCPQLVILMGSFSIAAVLGGKLGSIVCPNVFYTRIHGHSGKKRIYFAGDNILSPEHKVEKNLAHLLSFIQEYYEK